MNHFYTAINYIKDILLADPDVHTVTHGDNPLTDTQKKNIFPIAHISATGWRQSPGLILFDFNIAVLDQRAQLKEVVTDKFLQNTNELDNLNTCCAILNKFLLNLKLQRNEQRVELTNDPNAEPILLDFSNGLDGWEIQVTLSVPNKSNACY